MRPEIVEIETLIVRSRRDGVRTIKKPDWGSVKKTVERSISEPLPTWVAALSIASLHVQVFHLRAGTFQTDKKKRPEGQNRRHMRFIDARTSIHRDKKSYRTSEIIRDIQPSPSGRPIGHVSQKILLPGILRARRHRETTWTEHGETLAKRAWERKHGRKNWASASPLWLFGGVQTDRTRDSSRKRLKTWG